MDIEDLLDQLDDAEQSSPKFGKLLGAIEGFAQGGDLVAAEAIAEVFGSSKLHFDGTTSFLRGGATKLNSQIGTTTLLSTSEWLAISVTKAK